MQPSVHDGKPQGYRNVDIEENCFTIRNALKKEESTRIHPISFWPRPYNLNGTESEIVKDMTGKAKGQGYRDIMEVSGDAKDSFRGVKRTYLSITNGMFQHMKEMTFFIRIHLDKDCKKQWTGARGNERVYNIFEFSSNKTPVSALNSSETAWKGASLVFQSKSCAYVRTNNAFVRTCPGIPENTWVDFAVTFGGSITESNNQIICCHNGKVSPAKAATSTDIFQKESTKYLPLHLSSTITIGPSAASSPPSCGFKFSSVFIFDQVLTTDQIENICLQPTERNIAKAELANQRGHFTKTDCTIGDFSSIPAVPVRSEIECVAKCHQHPNCEDAAIFRHPQTKTRMCVVDFSKIPESHATTGKINVKIYSRARSLLIC